MDDLIPIKAALYGPGGLSGVGGLYPDLTRQDLFRRYPGSIKMRVSRFSGLRHWYITREAYEDAVASVRDSSTPC